MVKFYYVTGTFFLILFFIGLSFPSGDSCSEDTICEAGTELEACPPCWDKPCIISKELCFDKGGIWIEELNTCNLNMLSSKKYCEPSGGKWNEEKYECDYTELCTKI